MDKLEFKVIREMHGDRVFEAGDKRELAAVDAIALVRSGALEPSGKDAVAAMEQLLGPRAGWGVQAVAGPGPDDEAMETNNQRAAAEGVSPRPASTRTRSADAGGAPRVAADIVTPTIHAGEPGVTSVEPGAATPPPPPPPPPPATATPAKAKSSGKRSGRRR